MRLRIGIDGCGFNGWGGGIDFIATIAEALESTGRVQTFLIAGENSWIGKLYIDVKCLVKSKGSIRNALQMRKNENLGNERMFKTFKYCVPNTKIIIFRKTEIKVLNNREKKQSKCLKKNLIDILFPSLNCESGKFDIMRIGYIPDFQHKYLPELFDSKECKWRDKHFEQQLQNSKYIIVNAQDVKKDIAKYYPEQKCEVIVLPFKPFQKPEVKLTPDLSKYHLPKKYFVICNQFWMHKSHITAFEALEKLYCEGLEDIHIVCTGLMQDDRNPQFIEKLRKRVSELKCHNNIHFLGYIPKDDQIQIMKESTGLIQPTLFEGTPGGLAVYNAVCLGITCLVSDIDVNKEIIGYDNVYFFKKKNAEELAVLMKEHSDDIAIEEEIVNKRILKNRKEYGEFLLQKLEEIFYTNPEK